MRSILRIFAVIAIAIGPLTSCGGGGNEQGACVRGTGVSASCGDDFTSGQCGLVNGTFYESKSCKDLGFR